MKSKALLLLLIVCNSTAFAQNKNYKYGITAGAFIQHYNGNLGNSFFEFGSTCFAGVSTNFGIYLNKSFDFNLGGTVGHFGWCQGDFEENREVSPSQRCPGCTERFGMGDLRALMIAGNVAIKYKFANGTLLKEDAKFAPYVYAGIGLNHLSDVMKKKLRQFWPAFYHKRRGGN